ncbi:MAG: hydrogenase maturation protease [Candidatus Aenigmatarchaeota archaeon]
MTFVIGVGNELKCDDGMGSGKDILVIPPEVPENWIEPIIKFKPEVLILVDAADFGGKSGEIRVIREDEISKVFTNTHSVPLVLFLEAIKKKVKTKTIFIGIQPKTTGFEKPISREVREAGRKAADAIKKIVSFQAKV